MFVCCVAAHAATVIVSLPRPFPSHTVLAMSLAVFQLHRVRIPSLQVAAVLMTGLFVYDIFWVFHSANVFGKNVMLRLPCTDPKPTITVSIMVVVFAFTSTPTCTLTVMFVASGTLIPTFIFTGRFTYIPIHILLYSHNHDHSHGRCLWNTNTHFHIHGLCALGEVGDLASERTKHKHTPSPLTIPHTHTVASNLWELPLLLKKKCCVSVGTG